MAIYGNFKGTTQTSFKVGKSGSAIHSDDNQPTSATQGDVWMDSANTALKIYNGSDWNDILLDSLNHGNILLGNASDKSVSANLDVSVGSLGFVKSNPGIGGFVYNQSVAANVWSVSHNLGQQYLNIEIVDDTGNSITGTYGYPTINFVSANQLTATFTTPTAGYLVASSGQGYTGSTGGVGYTGSQGFTNFTVAGDTGTDIVNTGETINIVGVANQIETTVTNNQISMGIVDGANIANLTVTGNLSTEIISTTGNVDAGNVNVTDSLAIGSGGTGTISGVDVLTAGNVNAGNVNVTDAIIVAGGGGGTITGADSITANSIIVGNVNVSNDILAGYYVETYLALTGTTVAIDCTAASVFSLTTSGGTTFSFTNVPSTSNTAIGLTLEVTAGGTHTLTWPASVKWAGGSAPDAPASGETNIYGFYTRDAGTTWYGFLSGDAMA